MPGRKWYLIAVVVFILGGILAAAFAFLQLRGLGDEMPQIVVPGSAELVLEEPGAYTIFHEAESFVDGRYYSAADVSGLSVEVLSAETGQAVPLEPSGANTTYSLGGRSGRSVLGFEIEAPGAYRFTGSYDDGRSEPQTVLAVGHGFGRKLVLTIVGTIGIGFLAAGLAIAIAVITFVKRRRARRAAGMAVPPVVTAAPAGE
ncbi:MAG TPA: hypothetical protein VM737_03685 [Gemmatimonadota bacterium]|nr:hypothetical protein [Gemmatimonadota bacterium]